MSNIRYALAARTGMERGSGLFHLRPPCRRILALNLACRDVLILCPWIWIVV